MTRNSLHTRKVREYKMDILRLKEYYCIIFFGVEVD